MADLSLSWVEIDDLTQAVEELNLDDEQSEAKSSQPETTLEEEENPNVDWEAIAKELQKKNQKLEKRLNVRIKKFEFE